eukprot:12166774-Alexandrium_andersonii.AAC.1
MASGVSLSPFARFSRRGFAQYASQAFMIDNMREGDTMLIESQACAHLDTSSKVLVYMSAHISVASSYRTPTE